MAEWSIPTWRCTSCEEERQGTFCPACFQTYAIQFASHVREGLDDDVDDPLEMLKRLQAMPCYAWRREPLQLDVVTRTMRLLTRDTRKISIGMVHARSSEAMQRIMDHGEPKDLIQTLKNWGPETNAERLDISGNFVERLAAARKRAAKREAK